MSNEPKKADEGKAEKPPLTPAVAGHLRMLADWQIRERGYDPAEVSKLLAIMDAAPDLLASLESITADCREVLEGREPLTIELVHAIANGKARAAIAKAEGGAR